MEVAIDIGGTFTDFVFFDRTRRTVSISKVPSTPADPAAAVLAGLEDADMRQYGRFVHATTIVLNALLQRKGAKTALITTAGFRSHIEIGDTRRYTGGLFDHEWQREKPFAVPASRRLVLRERMSSRGEPILAPPAAELDALAEQLRELGVEAVAICFLNSYANPAHELLVRDALAAAIPDLRIFTSSSIPEFREYPRFMTAVLNAFASTKTSAYVERLSPALADVGYQHDVKYMGSSGGVQSMANILQSPMGLLMGGVVGGVTAGTHLIKGAGIADAVTFDMGGTSTDVALIKGGAADVAGERAFGAFPVALQQVDVHSIGAGGGSIAWAADGALKVGPRSAGADPGPACYGRGGSEFTITDANILLGRVGGELAGGMKLEPERAREAAERLAEELGIADVTELATGVLEVANTNLDGAIRQVSVERGEDPAQLALIAFGGAGPMHGCEVAERLDIRTVLIPRDAGNFSAWGLLVSDERHDYVRSFIQPLLGADPQEAKRLFEEMEREGRAALAESGFADAAIEIRYRMDIRYKDQAFEEEIELRELDDILNPELVGETFREAYERRYGYDRPVDMAESANLRLTAIGVTEKPDPESYGVAGGDAAEQSGPRTRQVYFDGEWTETTLLDRGQMEVGVAIQGPAVLEEYDSTTVLPPGWEAVADAFGNLRLERR